MIYHTIIIGAGPGGIAASIQLKRSGFEVFVLEENKVGGLLNSANFIENYPGFPTGIFGKELVYLFQKQLEKHKITVRIEKVRSIEKNRETFEVRTNKRNFLSKSIIIATGTIPNLLAIPGETELAGKRVFYEFEDVPSADSKETVTIIGSGDIAFDFALNLAKNGIKTNIVMRSDKPKCIPILSKGAIKDSLIKIYKNTVVKELFEEQDKVKIEVYIKNKKLFFVSDYVLVAIGRKPNLEFLPLEWQKLLYKNDSALENEGLFLAGDVNSNNFRHVGIAVGDGLRTAMVMARYLSCC